MKKVLLSIGIILLANAWGFGFWYLSQLGGPYEFYPMSGAMIFFQTMIGCFFASFLWRDMDNLLIFRLLDKLNGDDKND